MLDEIIDNVRKTVPNAFTDITPDIPWMSPNREPEIIALPKSEDWNTWPTIFVEPVEPNLQIPELDEEMVADVERIGTEALAWYISFHQSNNWGIYFRVRGLIYLSNFFKTKHNVDDINERMKIAFDILLYHELFHFLTDMTSAHMEILYKASVYNQYLKFLNDAPPTGALIEEPLANAEVLRRMPKKYHSKIEKIFSKHPDPYRQYGKFTSDIGYRDGKRKLGVIVRFHDTSRIVLEALKGFHSPDEPFWEFLFNVNPENYYMPQVPIYLVSERCSTQVILRFVSPITDGVKVAVYPGDHLPAHIHIWAPADNKRDGRYLYPTLEPYMGAIPLSNRQRKRVEKVLVQNKQIIEQRIQATT
jgi:hypothetical protein